MKYLLTLLICLSVGADDLLVIPRAVKGEFINVKFNDEPSNSRIRPPKNMDWEIISGEYVGIPKDNSSAKPQTLMYFWTPNPHEGVMMNFNFKFQDPKVNIEFSLGRGYATLYIQDNQLIFQRAENINGKMTRVRKDLGISINPRRWNTFHIEAHKNQYLIKINNENPVYTEAQATTPEKFGGLRINGSRTSKIFLDNIIQKAIDGPAADLESKIASYTRVGQKNMESNDLNIAQEASPQPKVDSKKKELKTPTPEAIKPVKTNKYIYI